MQRADRALRHWTCPLYNATDSTPERVVPVEQPTNERRLTTILAADVVGYSRIMGEDEAGTLAALKAHRKELIEPKTAQYRGRTVNLMGDGALMEFGSVVDAVHFAVEVQIAMRQRNSGVTEDRQIVFRIGINIGDIIVDNDDIYGDGVNVAARLEGLAEPGGICVARNVFNQVKGKLELKFEHLGDKEVKNIAEPVSVYRVIMDEKADGLVTAVRPSVSRRGLRPALMAAGIALLAVIGSLAWWQPWAPDVEPASVERMAFALPDRPSIAVMPFANITNAPEQEYLISGMTNDISTDLSRFRDLVVISTASTSYYKDKSITVQQIAEELGVQYVLQGSVQTASDQIRVNVQLIDALTGRHLWVERYGRQLVDVFALQDEITQSIVAVLGGPEGRISKAARNQATRKLETENLTAYEYYQLSTELRHKFTPKLNVESRKYGEKAIEIDPRYARAHVAVAFNYYLEFLYGWSDNPEYSLEKMEEYARKAVQLDDGEAEAHWILADVYYVNKQFDDAIAEYERAISLNPNHADILAEFGWVLPFISAGESERAIEIIEKAKRLNPYHLDWYDQGLGIALYFAHKYEEAVAVLNKVENHVIDTRATLAASYAQLDRFEEAREQASIALEMVPEFSINWWIEKSAFVDSTDADHFREGLRKASLPELEN